MTAGSENESGDEISELKTPAMQTSEDSFSQSSATKSTNNPTPLHTSITSEIKKVKLSPVKSKVSPATGSATNSKSTSPIKRKGVSSVAAGAIPHSKGKAGKK